MFSEKKCEMKNTLCLKKTANLCLSDSELCQISTNFGNFSAEDGKDAKNHQCQLFCSSKFSCTIVQTAKNPLFLKMHCCMLFSG